MTESTVGRTLAELLEAARSKIVRLEPHEAYEVLQEGAILVDIRADLDRQRNGVVPGAIHIPRTVLEWRLAPDGEIRSPYVADVDRRLVLLCDHGCSSVLAAANLAELGYSRVGDVVGGFEAWQAAGLPVVPARPSRPPGEPAGMQPPD